MYFNEDQIRYFGVDYEADESEYWRNNNDYLETDETLEDEYWRLYDKKKQIRQTIDLCYNFEYLTPEQETELQALLDEEEKIGFKLDEIEIKWAE